MMKQLRENTKWIMLAVAISFVALMVFDWGMDLTGRSGTQLSGGEIGRVNGQGVSYEEYNSVYRNLYDQQAAMVDGPIGTAMNRQIEDAAWEQVVMQRLVAQELSRRGIVVTNEEIRQAAMFEPPPEVRSNPMFQTDGQFDIAKYHQFMANPAVDTELLLQLEAYYRDAIPRSKLFFQQTAGLYATDDQLWQIWRDTRDSVSVRFLAFDPQALVPDEAVTVSDEEVGAYYREHRNEFLRPARATVKYVTIDRTPGAADSAAALERIRNLREQIVQGADFGELARRESSDSISAEQGGQFTVRRGQTVQAFEDAVFSLPLNQVSQPVTTEYGHHLIKVERRSADSATVRHILVPVELTLERENEVLDRADSLDILTETLKLDRIGQELGLEVQQTDLIPGLGLVPGIGEAADGSDWAFETATPGDVSEVFETPSVFYAFELVSREEERTLTQDEARETIRSALLAQKKLERAKEMAREAVDRIRAGQTMEAVASSLNLEVQEPAAFTRADFVPGLGRMNPAIGTAFGLRPGETSGVIESERTAYIIQLISRKDADRAAWEQQKEDQRQRVAQAFAQQRWENYLAALRESARIVDNRAELARQAAAAANATN